MQGLKINFWCLNDLMQGLKKFWQGLYDLMQGFWKGNWGIFKLVEVPQNDKAKAMLEATRRLFMQLCLQNDNVNFADNGRERKSSELQLRGF